MHIFSNIYWAQNPHYDAYHDIMYTGAGNRAEKNVSCVVISRQCQQSQVGYKLQVCGN